MVVIMRDAVMPECCKTCVCSEGYGCGITGTLMTTKEMESRPDWCPLEEVEPCEDAVSREAAIDIFDDYNVSVENGDLEAYSRDRKRLCELPSAQPEIIRCKDCENWKPQIEAENRRLGICSFHNAKYVTSEGYCYWAERRTDEE